MTLSEFAKTIRSKHPGAYDDMEDVALANAVITKYPQYKDMVDSSTNPESGDFERGPNYPESSYTTDAPSMDVALFADAAPKLAMAVPGMVKAVPGVIKGLAEGATDLGSSIAEAGGKVGDTIKGGWDALTGNTPRGFGYAKGVLKTPAMRDTAADAIKMANEAQPDLGQLVERASKRPIQSGSGAPALESGEKGLATGEDVANFPEGAPTPGEAPTDLPKPDTSMFETPIRQGLMSGSEDMFDAAETQRKAVGDAISNTLGRYDSTGTYYDPSKVNEMVKSMLERDVNGDVMRTGWQGKVNEAIDSAVASLRDFSQGGPIKWSDAARIKTGLQGDTNYAVSGFNKANEAYKQVASMLKDDIDNQAGEMLAKNGGNVQEYQTLRQAYGKLESLSEALNNRVTSKTANSTIPWWVKMAAGTVLAGKAGAFAKGLLGH